MFEGITCHVSLKCLDHHTCKDIPLHRKVFQVTSGEIFKNRTATMCQGLSILHMPPSKVSCCQAAGKYTTSAPHLTACSVRPLLTSLVFIWVLSETDAKGESDVQVFTGEMPMRENWERARGAGRATPPWWRTDLCRGEERKDGWVGKVLHTLGCGSKKASARQVGSLQGLSHRNVPALISPPPA